MVIRLVMLLLILAILIWLVYAATRPKSFRVVRAIQIQANADKVFSLIDDFHAWEAWSPWEKIDPACQRIYSGNERGVGAVYEWKGNKHVGHGRMEIREVIPAKKVLIQIDFFAPMEGHNTVEFSLSETAGLTQVVHAMYGPSPFLSRMMCVFFNMDKMIGGKFEEGLSAIKVLAENPKQS